MAQLLQGKEVADSLNISLKQKVEVQKGKGIIPTLGIIRIGERDEDIAYERAAAKRCAKVNVRAKSFILDREATEKELLFTISELNKDSSIHGILLLRPLPAHMDDNMVRRALLPEKDVDGITDESIAGVFTGSDFGFPPCTSQACMEILDYYGIDVTGKKVAVIGRSLVVGKPVAMMLLKRDATVTVCHTKTVDLPALCREAEVLIVAAGKAGAVDAQYLNENQIVIDVGIHVNKEGKFCGDVDFTQAEPIVKAITPVPGGVGTVTASILIKHVLDAVERG